MSEILLNLREMLTEDEKALSSETVVYNTCVCNKPLGELWYTLSDSPNPKKRVSEDSEKQLLCALLGLSKIL